MDTAMIAQAKEARTVEELMKLAKANHIGLEQEKAEELFRQLHAEGELSDDELDAASGGGCGNQGSNSAECDSGKTVTCNKCGRVMPKNSIWLYILNNDGTVICDNCESGQIQGDISRAYDMIAERNR